MDSWIVGEEVYEADDMVMDGYDIEIQRQLEKKAFESDPKQGKFAHAYDHDIDNVMIIQLRDAGKSLREIAKSFGCSPSTIRNRLKKMGLG